MTTATTAEEIVALIEAPDRGVDVSLTLLDENEENPLDITDDLDLVGSRIEHGGNDTIHGTGTLVLRRELQWAWQRVRPTVRFTSEYLGLELERNAGVWVLTTPERRAFQPFTVSVYDKLVLLNDEYGGTYSAASTDVVLNLVVALIEAAGESKIRVDQTAAGTTLGTDRLWPISDHPLRLGIINDLLDTINYRGLWVDRNGYYVLEPYQTPTSRAPSWTFDAGSGTATLGEDRGISGDYFPPDAPNRWVFYMNDPTQGLPVEGAGLYIVVNQSDGPASVDGRKGRYVTVTVELEAASHADLVAQGDKRVEADKRLPRHYSASVAPFLELWHFDTVLVTDPEFALNEVKFVVPDWSFEFSGADMRLDMREV